MLLLVSPYAAVHTSAGRAVCHIRNARVWPRRQWLGGRMTYCVPYDNTEFGADRVQRIEVEGQSSGRLGRERRGSGVVRKADVALCCRHAEPLRPRVPLASRPKLNPSDCPREHECMRQFSFIHSFSIRGTRAALCGTMAPRFKLCNHKL